MLPEHITVVNVDSLPWEADTPTEYLEQALIYNWLDTVHNLYHVMMENGNFIYATACRLLGACTHANSHYQILATVSSSAVLDPRHVSISLRSMIQDIISSRAAFPNMTSRYLWICVFLLCVWTSKFC